MNSLKGKKALVTGGASGIGRAISLELANMGAALIIHYHRSKESAESLAAQIHSSGGKAEVVQADLTEEAGVQALTDFVIERWDNLDVLVNNAGDLVGRHKLEEVQMDFYRKVVAVNLDSNVLVTRAMIPLLKKSGSASIVNLASLAGRKGGHGGSAIYSMTKGAILTLTRALSTELAPYGIRVNAVAPGFILGSAFHALHTSEESKQATIRDIPLKRAGTCEDVARAVAFLASEYDGFITGATLDINGGVYMA
ncbi:MAG TPA: SDR family NAD(P)-dependent oxidoreductase [Rectinema sp.]|nr:SDR family NAD(P)-dependent oxidoreductase [Rectinema sp.]HQE69123.1 SDR family NAD(P)-dependent oxidoreductase [Rectinema sp.]HQH95175.1 SDR family NAD(P)-dependent oxidoreductase [Rectinema sp.]HQK09866.1 SDR family NAD(P)-dependent oxidoreductase [Rectinema sp.]HRR38259.1 SDR family NAD(P)-dependent oxidoreductase [Rectinema sp.]